MDCSRGSFDRIKSTQSAPLRTPGGFKVVFDLISSRRVAIDRLTNAGKVVLYMHEGVARLYNIS